MKKTTVMRILESAKVSYEPSEYEYDDSDISGIKIAKVMGLTTSMVFKTLVAEGDKTGFIVFSIPVDKELDLKKAAYHSGNKKVKMVAVKDLLKIAGYVRGACSPIGMKKKFPTFVDESINKIERLSISAGQKGLQIILDKTDYISFIEGIVCDIIDDKVTLS